MQFLNTTKFLFLLQHDIICMTFKYIFHKNDYKLRNNLLKNYLFAQIIDIEKYKRSYNTKYEKYK